MREAAGRLPSQEEMRRALEARVGDWYMVRQPRNRTFPATIQRHSRGLWTNEQRSDLLTAVRVMSSDGNERALEDAWKAFDMEWLKVPVDAFQRAVSGEQRQRGDVSGAVAARVGKAFPGLETFRRLLDEDRIINRGNAHMDYRAVAPGGGHLLGWTLFTPGVMAQFLRSGKLIEVGRNKLLTFGERVRLQPGGKIEVDRIQAAKKSSQPLSWLTLVVPDDPTFEAVAGKVGATEATAGRFDLVTGAGRPFRSLGAGNGFSVVYGVQRSDFHELFWMFGDRELNRTIGGRWTFRRLSLSAKRPDITESQVDEGVLSSVACEWGTLTHQDEAPEGSVELQEQLAPEQQDWLARRDDDPSPFIFHNDFESEATQARKERNDLIWNRDAVDALRSAGYFRLFNLEPEFQKFLASPRSEDPPGGGAVDARPKVGLAPVPEKLMESGSA